MSLRVIRRQKKQTVHMLFQWGREIVQRVPVLQEQSLGLLQELGA